MTSAAVLGIEFGCGVAAVPTATGTGFFAHDLRQAATPHSRLAAANHGETSWSRCFAREGQQFESATAVGSVFLKSRPDTVEHLKKARL